MSTHPAHVDHEEILLLALCHGGVDHVDPLVLEVVEQTQSAQSCSYDHVVRLHCEVSLQCEQLEVGQLLLLVLADLAEQHH